MPPLVSPLITVLVPTHQHAHFLPRALGSLLDSAEPAWEALVLDDGSTDDTAAVLAPFLHDARLRTLGWPVNRGLGATLNTGLEAALTPLVAYLPADDVWYRDHLPSLLAALADPGVVLAHSGLDHHGQRSSLGAPEGFGLQLVQVAHRRTAARWTERGELESDDLHRLMWDRLVRSDEEPVPAASTGRVTCSWTDHPGQRHKAVRQSFDGGLNVFRARYGVTQPLRLHSSDAGTVDEVERYRAFRERRYPGDEEVSSGLDVLVVGELAHNPERILALAERGHRLHGLWISDPLGDSTVGPLPFGHVRELLPPGSAGRGRDWREAVRALAPDVVYALLNWRAVPLAHAVMREFPNLPLVWHFKESPQRAIVRGEWAMLADLVSEAQATLVATAEEREWLLEALPTRCDPQRIGVLDGDLPTAQWFSGPHSPKLSDADGQVHTAVVGRAVGLDADWLLALARRGVHTHAYGQVAAPGPSGAWRGWWADAEAAAAGHLHRHPAVGPDDWVRELSQYDAAWLHRFTSSNGGELARATWDDLNSPARLPVMLGAGLPVLAQANPGHRVAVERILAASGAGLLYSGADDAGADDAASLLHAEVASRAGARAALAVRAEHVIEAHVVRLEGVLAAVAAGRRPSGGDLGA